VFALVAASAVAGCADPASGLSGTPVALHVVVVTPGSGTVSFSLAPGTLSQLTAQGITRDSVPVGSTVSATWVSSDSTVLAVRDTTFGAGALAIPGARILARRAGQVTVIATMTSGGRTLVGQLSILVTSPPAR
jgi:hypothetical protein